MNIKHKKGFGILEVLLAGIVIVIVLGSLVFLARNTLNSSIYLSQKAQATFLAQEGIEIVRNIRDSNYIDSNNKTQWDTLLIDNSGDAKQAATTISNITMIFFIASTFVLNLSLRL